MEYIKQKHVIFNPIQFQERLSSYITLIGMQLCNHIQLKIIWARGFAAITATANTITP